VKQAPLVDGRSLDALSVFEDGPASAKVDIGRGQIIDALVIPLGVVVLDEAIDLDPRKPMLSRCSTPLCASARFL
jgi:hypothetical protein